MVSDLCRGHRSRRWELSLNTLKEMKPKYFSLYPEIFFKTSDLI